jgi:hypothetical protein
MARAGLPTFPTLQKQVGKSTKGSQNGYFQVGRLPSPEMEKSNEINAPQSLH